ncbi:cell wall hydrolase [Desulforamulus ruminis]|uniref:Cell wall hydrolase SleB n=1 Tax=Desulforamulus ruminis (strain ATCC 23193 / DSM 2154 / NCIMB 8452 / DL) TaxID=696281 RepID=F6DR84_DESRL|nr:cell wall hydrolase [Desulforamulus ruminis]AEG60919.1 cell wall hydrolase SleB [Desulforamulus ruminis DSM 2154]
MYKKQITMLKQKLENGSLETVIKKSVVSILIVSFMTLSVMPVFKPFMTTNTKPEVKKAPESHTQQEARSIEQRPEGNQKSRTSGQKQVSRGGLNRNEVRLLAMVIEGEAADEPYKGKVAVGAVILNRMESKQFPKTLSGVVYEDLAFESVMNDQYKRPLTQESIRAAQDAINGHDPTDGALYFWNPVTAKSKWVWSRPVTDQIGRHVFAK